ncbi:SWIM zinc finger family protein [Haladaptatus salinisoli]|uniref:SWIM zinc finger family protein n=1 Tax=Haladaptatus salinisoli TaxID=2884876 RepID=UPI001D0A91DE|nr:SWIM zinc finger family protein [Haladaptatus salinisoli]
MVEVTNESNDKPVEHHYVVTLDDVTDDAMACTYTHHVHQNAFCKVMAGVKNATDDGTLEAFPSEDSEDDDIDDTNDAETTNRQ